MKYFSSAQRGIIHKAIESYEFQRWNWSSISMLNFYTLFTTSLALQQNAWNAIITSVMQETTVQATTLYTHKIPHFPYSHIIKIKQKIISSLLDNPIRFFSSNIVPNYWIPSDMILHAFRPMQHLSIPVYRLLKISVSLSLSVETNYDNSLHLNPVVFFHQA